MIRDFSTHCAMIVKNMLMLPCILSFTVFMCSESIRYIRRLGLRFLMLKYVL